MKQIYITIDLEHDCPPYLDTYRGVVEGVPALLRLFEKLEVSSTFFSTGDIARRYSHIIEQILMNGHELGCHGDLHKDFTKISFNEASQDIKDATKILREFDQVQSFRAPYLKFPEKYLSILDENGYTVDSSQAKYKFSQQGKLDLENLTRIPVSMTSLLIRLPDVLRNRILKRLKSPVVLFVHPWEFVDFTKTKLRFDCRYNTGQKALNNLEKTILFFKSKGNEFKKIKDYI